MIPVIGGPEEGLVSYIDEASLQARLDRWNSRLKRAINESASNETIETCKSNVAFCKRRMEVLGNG